MDDFTARLLASQPPPADSSQGNRGRGRGRSFLKGNGDWDCPSCGNINFARRTECNRCGASPNASASSAEPSNAGRSRRIEEDSRDHRGDGSGRGRGRGRGGQKGANWICPNIECGNNNFPNRAACNKCGEARPRIAGSVALEIGEDLAKSSNGLFGPQDWQCANCGNVNWAKRSTCNMCNGPKFAKIEERKGAGGGFKENEGIEYNDRNSDDELYDEFGRVKKKYRHPSDTVLGTEQDSVPVNPTGRFDDADEELIADAEQAEEVEDDEEEEDGDVDLTKYDLDAVLADVKPEVSTRPKSRSRSPKPSSHSHSPRHKSRSPRRKSRSRSPRRRHSSRSRSRSPRRSHRRSRSRSPRRHRSKSRSRSRSPRRHSRR